MEIYNFIAKLVYLADNLNFIQLYELKARFCVTLLQTRINRQILIIL